MQKSSFQLAVMEIRDVVPFADADRRCRRCCTDTESSSPGAALAEISVSTDPPPHKPIDPRGDDLERSGDSGTSSPRDVVSGERSWCTGSAPTEVHDTLPVVGCGIGKSTWYCSSGLVCSWCRSSRGEVHVVGVVPAVAVGAEIGIEVDRSRPDSRLAWRCPASRDSRGCRGASLNWSGSSASRLAANSKNGAWRLPL